jgi:hypothetical protein
MTIAMKWHGKYPFARPTRKLEAAIGIDAAAAKSNGPNLAAVDLITFAITDRPTQVPRLRPGRFGTRGNRAVSSRH